MNVSEKLQYGVYGRLPSPPEHLSVSVTAEDRLFCGGKAVRRDLILHADCPGGRFDFPALLACPTGEGFPLVILPTERAALPGRDCPVEEILDRGFGVLTFSYPDVSPDNGDFRSGLSRCLAISRRSASAPGKLALWAWATERLTDLACATEGADIRRIYTAGFGVAGEVALLAAAFDDRIAGTLAVSAGIGACPNNAAGTEGGYCVAEVFAHRYAPRYGGYRDAAPADLLRMLSDRFVFLAASEDERGFSPARECAALFGETAVTALPVPYRRAEENRVFTLRAGAPFFSRADWSAFFDALAVCRIPETV